MTAVNVYQQRPTTGAKAESSLHHADLKYRGELRLENYTNLFPFPLSPLGERAGVRG